MRPARSARAAAGRSPRPGLEGEVDAIVGTLGKALGSYGAYVCADEEMVRYLINTSRSFIFSTARRRPRSPARWPRSSCSKSARTASSGCSPNARVLRRALASEGFPVAEGDMHIVPLVVGDERDALRLCQEAIEQGVFAQAIRPPTVPAGTSRLRLAAMASHTATDMRMAAGVLAAAARKLGLDPAEMGPPLPEPEPAEGWTRADGVELEPSMRRAAAARRSRSTSSGPAPGARRRRSPRTRTPTPRSTASARGPSRTRPRPATGAGMRGCSSPGPTRASARRCSAPRCSRRCRPRASR